MVSQAAESPQTRVGSLLGGRDVFWGHLGHQGGVVGCWGYWALFLKAQSWFGWAQSLVELRRAGLDPRGFFLVFRQGTALEGLTGVLGPLATGERGGLGARKELAMRYSRTGLLVLVVFLAGGRQAVAIPVVFKAVLDGAHVKPDAVPTPATGSATLVLHELGDRLAFAVTFQDLLSYTTRIDIHVGWPDEVGPEIFLLHQGEHPSPIMGELMATHLIPQPSLGIETFDDAIAALEAGKTYMEIHTPAYYHEPFLVDVELRGQLAVIPEPSSVVIWCLVGAIFGLISLRRIRLSRLVDPSKSPAGRTRTCIEPATNPAFPVRP